MFGSIKIAMVLVVLATAGGGFLWIKNLQSDLEIARANAAKLEVAIQTSEASLKLLQEDNRRLNDLATALNEDLRKAEQYGDELRATLQRHNLTHLATQKPGLIEKRMQDATDQLWNDLESITTPPGMRDVEPGAGDSNSNQD